MTYKGKDMRECAAITNDCLDRFVGIEKATALMEQGIGNMAVVLTKMEAHMAKEFADQSSERVREDDILHTKISQVHARVDGVAKDITEVKADVSGIKGAVNTFKWLLPLSFILAGAAWAVAHAVFGG